MKSKAANNVIFDLYCKALAAMFLFRIVVLREDIAGSSLLFRIIIVLFEDIAQKSQLIMKLV